MKKYLSIFIALIAIVAIAGTNYLGQIVSTHINSTTMTVGQSTNTYTIATVTSFTTVTNPGGSIVGYIDYEIWAYVTNNSGGKIYSPVKAFSFVNDISGDPYQADSTWDDMGADGYVMNASFDGSAYSHTNLGNTTAFSDNGNRVGWTIGDATVTPSSPQTYVEWWNGGYPLNVNGVVACHHLVGLKDDFTMTIGETPQLALDIKYAPLNPCYIVGSQTWEAIAGTRASSILGGVYNRLTNSNPAYGSYVVIGGGYNNFIDGKSHPADGSVIAGGQNNIAYFKSSTVSGGTANTAGTNGTPRDGGNPFYATVGGGNQNIAENDASTVAGGELNYAFGPGSTIAGGGLNRAYNYASTTAGGYQNISSNDYSTVSGGRENHALYSYATIAGGYGNLVTNSLYGTILGGLDNIVGAGGSVAFGIYAHATNANCFVWSDGSGVFGSFLPNQVSMYAANGYRFFGNGLALSANASGPAWVTNGLSAFWNSNGYVTYLRTCPPNSETYVDTPIGPP